MSASSSGSSGSIARGSIVMSTSSPAPFAFTVTMPLPAVDVRAGRQLEREGVVCELGRGRLLEQAGHRDRAFADRLDDAPLPGIRDLLEVDLRRLVLFGRRG